MFRPHLRTGLSVLEVGAAAASHTHTGVYQPLDNDLTAIAGLTSTGLLKRTGTDS